ncbi:PLAC8 family-domain-containing protein, partial [Massariosphaeria phaeospora]
SYAQTPIEHRAPYYISSPNDPPLPQSPPTPIDPRPQSTYDPRSSNPPATSYLSSLQPDEKPPFSPLTPHYGTPPPPFSPVSPMTEPQRIYIQQSHMPHVLHPHHGRQLSSLSPINTNLDHQTNLVVPVTPHSYNTQASPLPQKTPITPISPGVIKKDPAGYPLLASANSNNGYSAEPYSPHGFSSATNTRHAVFSPDSAHGPNGLDFTLHQPGQIAHPNMDLSGKGKTHEWKHSLCECSGDISTCLTGLFCPCILYGRTSYRMTQKSEKKDPTDMLGYKSTNGYCMLMGVSCGLWWLFPLYQRTRVRHAYKLSGSLGSDVVKAGCCCCCIAIQNEREVRDREESTRRWAGPASTEVYTAPRQMVYSPQR